MYMCDMCVPTKYTCTNIVQSHCNLQEYYYLAKKEEKKKKERKRVSERKDKWNREVKKQQKQGEEGREGEKEDGEKLVSQVEITDQPLPSRAFNLE